MHQREGGPDERVDQALEGHVRTGGGAILGHGLQPQLVDIRPAPDEHRPEELLLVAEIVAHEGRVDAGGLSHFVQGDAVVAFAGEQGFSLVEDQGRGFPAAFTLGSAHPTPRAAYRRPVRRLVQSYHALTLPPLRRAHSMRRDRPLSQRLRENFFLQKEID